MSHIPKHHIPRRRPGWWPENELWPPAVPRGRMMRSHFIRRLGCLFTLLVFAVATIIILILGLVAHLFGVLQIPSSLAFTIPIGLFIIGFGILVWVGRGLRRVSVPLRDLLEAADRLAGGDYSTRVPDSGPSEVRSLARAFNNMASRLQVTNEQRRDLLADVTHELRTPLTVIQGNLEGMLDGVYAANEERLKSILEETQVLSRLVDDLRTLVLAESGALQLKKEPTDLVELLGETVAAFRAQADTAGVELDLVAMDGIPRLNLDPQRMHEVLSNILANALRYTPSGGSIRIGCDMTTNNEERRVVVTIEDTGPGIKPEDLPYVFNRFYKARDSGGMGLGLSIAKHLVEAHSGTIEAESNFDNGTTIRITLPADE